MVRHSTMQTLPGNPYNAFRPVQPDITECVLCDRKIKTKDWSAHKNSKAHRKLEQDELKASQPQLQSEGGPVQGSSDSAGFGSGAEAWDGNNGSTTDSGAWVTSTDGFTDNNTGQSSNANTRGGDGGCYHCGDEGHRKFECPKRAPRPSGCFNCGMDGHRIAECTEPRKPRGGDRACFNCGQPGHNKADCTEPSKPRERDDSQQQCFNCYQFGHRKSDCTNDKVMKCRNCDGIGHEGRDCPKPKDWTRVQCNNCKEFGHTIKRCKAPIAEDNTGNWSANDSGAAAGDWNTNSVAAAGSWNTDSVAATGDWNNDDTAAGSGWGGSDPAPDTTGGSSSWAEDVPTATGGDW